MFHLNTHVLHNTLQISDDEDDTHPNVDTPSLFKWRHEARLEKMKEMEQEKALFLKAKNE
jgi:cell division cycle protein 37